MFGYLQIDKAELTVLTTDAAVLIRSKNAGTPVVRTIATAERRRLP